MRFRSRGTPRQSAHATANPSNGQMTVYSNDMKSYGMRTGVAQFLGMPRDKVRVVSMEARKAMAAPPPTMPVAKPPTSRKR